MVVSIFLFTFAEKSKGMNYMYGKTKVKMVIGNRLSEFEKEVNQKIEAIEKDNGFVRDVKFMFNYDNYIYHAMIIYSSIQ